MLDLINLRNSLKGTDVEDIKKKTQDLVQASMKLGEAVYKSQQSAKPGDAPKDADKKEDYLTRGEAYDEIKKVHESAINLGHPIIGEQNEHSA